MSDRSANNADESHQVTTHGWDAMCQTCRQTLFTAKPLGPCRMGCSGHWCSPKSKLSHRSPYAGERISSSGPLLKGSVRTQLSCPGKWYVWIIAILGSLGTLGFSLDTCPVFKNVQTHIQWSASPTQKIASHGCSSSTVVARHTFGKLQWFASLAPLAFFRGPERTLGFTGVTRSVCSAAMVTTQNVRCLLFTIAHGFTKPCTCRSASVALHARLSKWTLHLSNLPSTT